MTGRQLPGWGDRIPTGATTAAADDQSREDERLTQRIAHLEHFIGRCSQCGGSYIDMACGPTHAVMRARRENVDTIADEHHALQAERRSIDHALRKAGIEHPLGPSGVHDLAGMATGRLEDLKAADHVIRAVHIACDTAMKASLAHCGPDHPCSDCEPIRNIVNDVRIALGEVTP